MREYIQARVRREENVFLAECSDLPVSVRGASVDEAVGRLQAEIRACLETNDPAWPGEGSEPQVLVTLLMAPDALWR